MDCQNQLLLLNWLTLFALIIGPIAAVQIEKYLERSRDDKKNKLAIFKSLMATRSSKLSPEHVRALNMIELEFYGNRKVIKLGNYIMTILIPKEKEIKLGC